MRNLLVSLGSISLGLALLAGTWLLDPIHRLQVKLWENPQWVDGGFSTVLRLGPEAGPKEVLDKALPSVGWTTGKVHRYRLIATRTVYFPGSHYGRYPVVLFESDQGRKIMLMHYDPRDAFWWTQFFDAD